MSFSNWKVLQKITALLASTPPEPEHLESRIRNMERNIVIPVKLVVLSLLFYYLFFSKWFDTVMSAREVVLEVLQRFYLVALLLNVAAAIMIIGMAQVPLRLVELVVFAIALIDSLLVGGLTVISGGFDSMLYWVFLALIVRNAVSIPAAPMQILVNFLTSLVYLVAGLLEVAINQFEPEPGAMEATAEPFVLRLVLLLVMTLCCYAVQVLLERQRRAEEEAREFALRQEQLRVTSRLAAEIAHQLKNPLSIINNAAFNLQRNVKEGKATITQQIRIIREEVDRSDRIITDMMGYARMVDGNLERLQAPEMLDLAIEQVFPPAAHFPVQVHRDYALGLPPLLMQRNHLSDMLVNLLQNAREAEPGNVWIAAHCGENYSVLITITDDGPGVPAELREKVFEPYFTTKEKGSGLGLAIVKHNVEIYGGSVKVESEPGKGAKFVLQLPARSLIKIRR
jgi:signal transduction histidine kinase